MTGTLRTHCEDLHRRERDRIEAACEPGRAEVLARVESALLASGLIAPADVKRCADRWYGRWIGKAADEVVYLGLDAGERRLMVKVSGLSALSDALRPRGTLLLAGLHLGTHTLGVLHLDTLGFRTSILVHEEMLTVMPQYGFEHASWVTPGPGFLFSLTSDGSGACVTYCDVGRSGMPIRIRDGECDERSPGLRLVQRHRPAYTWRFSTPPGSGPGPGGTHIYKDGLTQSGVDYPEAVFVLDLWAAVIYYFLRRLAMRTDYDAVPDDGSFRTAAALLSGDQMWTLIDPWLQEIS